MSFILWFAAAMAGLWLYGAILATIPQLLGNAVLAVVIGMFTYTFIDAWRAVGGLVSWKRGDDAE